MRRLRLLSQFVTLDEGIGQRRRAKQTDDVAAGNAYVTGYTYSQDFPITSDAYQLQNNEPNGPNAFVTKLNASGNTLVYSTYLGGSGDTNWGDDGYGIAVDAAGDAYVTGGTGSDDFPLSPNPLQSKNLNTPDGFTGYVTELNPMGSDLVYSTFLGGTGNGLGHAIAVDAAGEAFITGSTYSDDFPTQDPLQAANGGYPQGNSNAFVTELNASGSALVYSTYLGGSGNSSNSLSKK